MSILAGTKNLDGVRQAIDRCPRCRTGDCRNNSELVSLKHAYVARYADSHSRRDGTPFMNLLLIAPLYDNKGTVRYFLGCQIDVSPLIEAGRGLESFQQLLSRDRTDSRFGGRSDRKPAEVLAELGAMFNEEESNTMKQQSVRYGDDPRGRTPPQRTGRTGRRVLGMDDSDSDRALWPHPSLGPSGRLPGVYQNVRPLHVFAT